jgi:hypothetical protein
MMNGRPTSRWRRPARRAATVLCACLFQFILSCGDGGEPADRPAPRTGPESFTFFDVGRNSVFSENTRRLLAEGLGNDAIERRSIIDLEINYPGFLIDHLPELDALNRQFNHPPGERVEHDVIRLMYRYARGKNSPFDFVELIFDGASGSPLVFNMRFKVDGAGAVESLRTKYGPPDRVHWKSANGESFVWRKERDVLAVSLVPDQFGEPVYHINLYFTDNLKRLIAAEQALKEPTSRGKSQSKRFAF